MNAELKCVINTLKEDLAYELTLISNLQDEVLHLILNAYNQYQESEKEGVDYLFHIENTGEVICCCRGGMTTEEVAGVYNGYKEKKHTGYFLFGQNYDGATPIKTLDELKDILTGSLDEVLMHVVCYPYSSDAYRSLYTHCVTDYMIREGIV